LGWEGLLLPQAAINCANLPEQMKFYRPPQHRFDLLLNIALHQVQPTHRHDLF
jgi:hypothetical protein